MKAWPYAAAALMVGATLAFVQYRARNPTQARERPLVDLPRTHAGGWRVVRDLPLTAKELDLLKLSDYVSRLYTGGDGNESPILLYIGYYASQNTGSTYHSPLNCLPGSGWQVEEMDYVAVPGAAGLQVKRLVIRKDLRRDVVLYWYQDRGRVITNEYAAKVWLIWDGLRWDRTDGALVRISAPVVTTPEDATERALRFMSSLFPTLQEQLPPPSRS